MLTGNANVYNDGFFIPVEDLTLLSENDYTTLSHPEFPRYSVRMKKSTDFCDTTVKYVVFATTPIINLDSDFSFLVHTQATSILRPDIYSFTFSRVEMTQIRTM